VEEGSAREGQDGFDEGHAVSACSGGFLGRLFGHKYGGWDRVWTGAEWASTECCQRCGEPVGKVLPAKNYEEGLKVIKGGKG
jgi:hypothetical protein